MKELTLKEFNKLNISLTDYQKKEIENQKKLCEEINKFHPASLLFSVYENDGKLYFEWSVVQLGHDFLDLTIRYDGYRKKYDINANLHCFNNLGNNDKNNALNAFERPNKIGVPTTKKINDWISYYEKVYKALEEENKGNTEKINSFLKGLEGLPVKWSKGGKSGILVKNGIEFSFKIEDGGISQNMSLHYIVSANIETFKKLSDNKFK